MKDFWGPNQISNPSLKDDLIKYFFKNISDEQIENILKTKENELELICNRYEFISKLMELRQILIQRREKVFPKITKSEIEDKPVFEVIHEDKVSIDGIEFNGVRFDIEALCQYLLLSLIDTIMGKTPYKTFNEWLVSQIEDKSYTLNEILDFEKRYQEEYGLSRNFNKAFSDYLPNDIKDRLLKTFIISKVDLGTISDTNIEAWNNIPDSQKLKKIATYLYSDIRCKYTHSCSRKFLNVKKIISMKPTKEKLLLNKINPEDDNLINILKDLIVNLVNQKYIANKF